MPSTLTAPPVAIARAGPPALWVSRWASRATAREKNDNSTPGRKGGSGLNSDHPQFGLDHPKRCLYPLVNTRRLAPEVLVTWQIKTPLDSTIGEKIPKFEGALFLQRPRSGTEQVTRKETDGMYFALAESMSKESSEGVKLEGVRLSERRYKGSQAQTSERTKIYKELDRGGKRANRMLGLVSHYNITYQPFQSKSG
jgi:hypothetical protein